MQAAYRARLLSSSRQATAGAQHGQPQARARSSCGQASDPLSAQQNHHQATSSPWEGAARAGRMRFAQQHTQVLLVTLAAGHGLPHHAGECRQSARWMQRCSKRQTLPGRWASGGSSWTTRRRSWRSARPLWQHARLLWVARRSAAHGAELGAEAVRASACPAGTLVLQQQAPVTASLIEHIRKPTPSDARSARLSRPACSAQRACQAYPGPCDRRLVCMSCP